MLDSFSAMVSARDRRSLDSVQALIDSATQAGLPVATVTSTVSVALAPSGLTRLAQVRGVEGYAAAASTAKHAGPG